MNPADTILVPEGVPRVPAPRSVRRLLQWPIASRSRDAALEAQGYTVLEREDVLGVR